MKNLERIEQRLTKRKEELEQRLQEIEHNLDQPVTNDIEDRATEREDDEVMESMGNAGLIEIAAIDAALARIEAGSFGTCGECGEPISQERLEILPTATKCRKCM